jgi:hypothetical protein
MVGLIRLNGLIQAPGTQSNIHQGAKIVVRHIKQFLAGLGVLACIGAHATPVDFLFRFDNQTGNAGGVVTGRILGLLDNVAYQTATSVLIDSYTELEGALKQVDAVLWGDVYSNSFSVLNGELTAYDFLARGDRGVGSVDTFSLRGGRMLSESCFNGACDAPFLSLDSGLTTIAGGTLTFEMLNNAQEVPEPATLTLVGLASIGLLAAHRRRDRGSHTAPPMRAVSVSRGCD